VFDFFFYTINCIVKEFVSLFNEILFQKSFVLIIVMLIVDLGRDGLAFLLMDHFGNEVIGLFGTVNESGSYINL
jgi:hypothetical protein